MLDPHAQAHEPVAQPVGGAHLDGHVRVRLHRRARHQRLHAAQGLGEGEHPHRGQEAGHVHRLGQIEAHHARVPRVEHARHVGARAQELRDRGGVGLVALHAQRQGLESAQQQEAVEGAQRRPGGVEAVVQPLGQGVVGHHRHARHDVVVPAQVLRARVDDDVGPQLQGPLHHRGVEGVVHDQPRPGRMGQLGRLGDGDLLHHRVRGGLDDDQVGRVGQGSAQALQAQDEVDVGRPLLGQDLQESEGAAVQVPQRHDPAAVRRQRAGHQLQGRHPRGQGEGRRPALQAGQGVLEDVAGGAGRARVVVARRLAQARVAVGGRQVDRRRDRTRGRVGPGARAHQQRLQAELRVRGRRRRVVVDGEGAGGRRLGTLGLSSGLGCGRTGHEWFLLMGGGGGKT